MTTQPSPLEAAYERHMAGSDSPRSGLEAAYDRMRAPSLGKLGGRLRAGVTEQLLPSLAFAAGDLGGELELGAVRSAESLAPDATRRTGPRTAAAGGLVSGGARPTETIDNPATGAAGSDLGDLMERSAQRESLARAFVTAAMRDLDEHERANNPYVPSEGFMGLVEDAATSLPVMGAALVAGAAGGIAAGPPGAAAAAGSFFAVSEGSAQARRVYESRVGEVGEDQARAEAREAGAVYGVASAALEVTGLGVIAKAPGMRTALSRVASRIATSRPAQRAASTAAGRAARGVARSTGNVGLAATGEGSTETIQGVLGDAIESWVTEDPDAFRTQVENLDQRGREFLVGALVGGGVRTVADASGAALTGGRRLALDILGDARPGGGVGFEGGGDVLDAGVRPEVVWEDRRRLDAEGRTGQGGVLGGEDTGAATVPSEVQALEEGEITNLGGDRSGSEVPVGGQPQMQVVHEGPAAQTRDDGQGDPGENFALREQDEAAPRDGEGQQDRADAVEPMQGAQLAVGDPGQPIEDVEAERRQGPLVDEPHDSRVGLDHGSDPVGADAPRGPGEGQPEVGRSGSRIAEVHRSVPISDAEADEAVAAYRGATGRSIVRVDAPVSVAASHAQMMAARFGRPIVWVRSDDTTDQAPLGSVTNDGSAIILDSRHANFGEDPGSPDNAPAAIVVHELIHALERSPGGDRVTAQLEQAFRKGDPELWSEAEQQARLDTQAAGRSLSDDQATAEARAVAAQSIAEEIALVIKKPPRAEFLVNYRPTLGARLGDAAIQLLRKISDVVDRLMGAPERPEQPMTLVQRWRSGKLDRVGLAREVVAALDQLRDLPRRVRDEAGAEPTPTPEPTVTAPEPPAEPRRPTDPRNPEPFGFRGDPVPNLVTPMASARVRGRKGRARHRLSRRGIVERYLRAAEEALGGRAEAFQSITGRPSRDTIDTVDMQMADGQHATDHASLSFEADRLPAEITEALEGEPRNVKSMFQAGRRGGRGAETMAEIGADEMVQIARGMVRPANRARPEELADAENRLGEQLATHPEFEMASLLYNRFFGAGSGRIPDDVDTLRVSTFDRPGRLPDGSTFELTGETFTVYTNQYGERRAWSDELGGFNLSAVEQLVTDADTLRIGTAEGEAAFVEGGEFGPELDADGEPIPTDDREVGITPAQRAELLGGGGEEAIGPDGLPVPPDDGIPFASRRIEPAAAPLPQNPSGQRRLFQRTGEPRPGGRPFGRSVSSGRRAARRSRLSTRQIFDESYDLDPRNVWDEIRTLFQDRFLRVRQVQRQIVAQSADTLNDDSDIDGALTRFGGRRGERINRYWREHVDPLAEAMRSAGVSADDLGAYLYALHAPERNAHLRRYGLENGSGISDREASIRLAELQTEHGEGTLSALVGRVRTMIDERLAELESEGLLEPELVEVLRKRYENYVPLQSAENADGDLMAAMGMREQAGGGFDVRGSAIDVAFGRGEEARNPLVSAVMQGVDAASLIERNRVAKTVAQFARRNPDSSLWNLNPVPLVRVMDPENQQIRTEPDPAALRRPNIMAFKEDGQTRYIEINDPYVARALKLLSKTADSATPLRQVVRWYRQAMQFFKATRTSLSPEFLLVNWQRDALNAAMNRFGDGASHAQVRRVLLGTFRGIFEAFRAIRNGDTADTAANEWRRDYVEMAELGGTSSFYELRDFDQTLARFNQLANGSPIQRGRQAFTAMADLISDVNKAAENAARLSIYRAMKAEGATPEQAAVASKEITVDFDRRGEAGEVLNMLYAFANASVQGSARTLRALRGRRGRALAGGVVGASLLHGLIMRAINGDDEFGQNRYGATPEWDRANNAMVMVPGVGTVKVPLPYGYNALWYAGDQAAAMMWGAIREDQGTDPVEAAFRVAGATASAFSPLGVETSETVGGTLTRTLAPTFARPVVELYGNEDFTGRPITPRRFPGDARPNAERSFRSTPAVFTSAAHIANRMTGGDEATSGAIDVAPETIQHWYRFGTGAVGTFFERLSETAANATTRREPVEIREIPFVRRYVGARTSTRAIRERYYELQDELASARTRQNIYERNGNREGYDAMRSLPIRRAENPLRVYREMIQRVREADVDAPASALNDLESELMREAALVAGALMNGEQAPETPVLTGLGERMAELRPEGATP